MYSHIEVLQSTHIKNVRIILGADSQEEQSKLYILSFEETQASEHDNDILSRFVDEEDERVGAAMPSEDMLAIDVYLRVQRYYLKNGVEQFGSLDAFLNHF